MLMAQMNPLDLPGPAFLALYLVLLVSALIIAFMFRRWLVARGENQTPVVRLDPYEAAFLSNGRDAVIDTAIAMLVQRQVLKAVSATRSLATSGSLPRDAHPVERAVYQAVARSATPVKEVRAAALWSVEEIGERLKNMGLILSDARWRAVRAVPTLIMVAVLALGIAKVFVGLSRNRPVSILVELSFVTVVIALLFFFVRPRATPAGEYVLLQLKLDNAALHATARSRPQMLTPGDMAYAIGLFGIGALPFVDDSWTELRQTLNPPPSATSSSGSGNSCSSGSSCSSSSSCGSSCGGGGGCGGCGGG